MGELWWVVSAGVVILIALFVIFTVSMAWVNPAAAENFDRQNLRMAESPLIKTYAATTTPVPTWPTLTSAMPTCRACVCSIRLWCEQNLSGADMTGATLDGARFTQADLTNAILEGAYAFGTDFRGAKIDGADFTDVLLDPKVNDRLCEVAEGVNPVTKRATRDTL